MPSNTIRTYNDPVLNKFVRGYMPLGMEFVRKDLLPSILVKTLRGDILVGGSEYLSIQNDVINGHSETPILTCTMSIQDGFRIKSYGIKKPITKEDAIEFGGDKSTASFSMAKTQFGTLLKKNRMISSENGLAIQLTTPGNYAGANKTQLVGTAQYNGSTSDPVGDFITAREAIYNAVGLLPNVATVPWNVFNVLAQHPDLIARMSNDVDRQKGLTSDQLARAMQVDRVLVPSAQKNTAALGQPKSLSPIWGKHVVFAYVNPNPTPQRWEDSLGYRYMLEEIVTDSFTENDPKNIQYVRVTEEHDDVIHDFGAAYLIEDAIA